MLQGIFRLYRWAENIWFKLPEKLRFLLVGGFNTVFAYAVLLLLNWGIGALNDKQGWHLSLALVANVALVVQYILTINVSFVTMRYYVFRSSGNWRLEWLKAWSVYIFIYCINAPILTFLMTICRFEVWLAQGIYLTVSAIITFLLHKYFSFRKKMS